MTAQRMIAGRAVHPIAFGPMRMSAQPGFDRADAIRTIHAAFDIGAELIDTADCYAPTPDAMHHNEALLAEALRLWPGDKARILVATKGGHVRVPDTYWARDGRPGHLRATCEASLRALGVERIWLYQLHSPDPAVPFEDQIGALARLREEGKIAHVGLCNSGRKQIVAARAIVPVASVQSEYSPWARTTEGVIAMCAADGIAFLAWSPLGGGSGRLPAVDAIAAARGISPQQVVLAWLLARSPALIPLIGATRPETARDSLSAAMLALDPAEIAAIEAGLPPPDGVRSASPARQSRS